MNKYKPNYLGKVLYVDDPSQMTNFLSKQYDSFSKIYDVCKDQSDSINDIKTLNYEDDSLTIKISTDLDTLKKLKDIAIDDPSINIIDDTITIKK